MNTLYAWIIAALIAAASLAGVLGYWRGGVAATEAANARMDKHILADIAAENTAIANSRALEQKLSIALAGESTAYEKGKKDAEAIAESVVSDLRSGNLRLQHRWASCETGHLSGAAAAAGELNAASRDREESAGRVVRAAAQCDSQVKGLQNLLNLERAP